jgi:hypothetical protein
MESQKTGILGTLDACTFTNVTDRASLESRVEIRVEIRL